MNYLSLDQCVEKVGASLEAQSAVVYCGRGLSIAAGYPRYQDFVGNLVTWARTAGFLSTDFAAQATSATANAQNLASVVDIIDLKAEDRAALAQRFLGPLYRSRGHRPSQLHRCIANLPWSAFISATYDDALERALRRSRLPSLRDIQTLCSDDADVLQQLISQQSPFLLRPLGDLERPESIVLGATRFDSILQSRSKYCDVLRSIFHNRTVVFIGASFESVDFMMSRFAPARTSSARHIAILSHSTAHFDVRATQLDAKYNIDIAPTLESDNSKYLEELFHKLSLRQRKSARSGAPEITAQEPAKLGWVRLVNIGPFAAATFDFDPKTTILLGDNGVGKSTVLKAVAVALSGVDAKEHAARLVRAGQTEASIELAFVRGAGVRGSQPNKYFVEIDLKSGVEVRAFPARALDVEGVLAIGIPPLRTVSSSRPRGPALAFQSTGPRSSDLLPLIAGGLDPRVDSLKQWLVNLDYWQRSATRATDRKAFAAISAQFFKLIRDLAPGLVLGEGKVRAGDNLVTVTTQDGEVPVDMVSQGLVSLLGWVGVLLQRLYEAHGPTRRSVKAHALVLIDELDAHLHPRWQQSILAALAEAFPNVQFVATTHSPLVVAGLQDQQLIRLARGADGAIYQAPVGSRDATGTVDDILSTPLFGLESTLDPSSRKKVDRLKALTAKKSLSKGEQSEKQQLGVELLFVSKGVVAPDPEREAFERARVEELKKLAANFHDIDPAIATELQHMAQLMPQTKAKVTE